MDFETFSKSDFRAVKVKDCVPVPKSKKLLQFTLDDGTGHDLDENISNKSKELCIICGKQIMKWSLCFIIGFAIDLLWVGAGLILAAILNTVLLFRLMVLRDHFENGK